VSAGPSDAFFNGDETWSTSLWTVTKHQDRLDVSFGDEEPVRMRWSVTLRTGRLRVSGQSPSPTTDDGQGDLSWDVTSAAGQDIGDSASVALPARLAWEWRAWSPPAGDATDLLNFLSYGLAYYVVVFLLSRRFAKRRSASGQAPGMAASAQWLAGLGILLFTVGWGIDLLNSYASTHNFPQHYAAALEAAISSAAGAAVFFPGRRHRGAGKITAAEISLLGVLGVATLLPAANIFPADLLPLALAMFLFYAGIAFRICRLWPVISSSAETQASPGPAPVSRRQAVWCLAVSASLTALDVLDPITTAARDWGNWFLADPDASKFHWVANSAAYVTEQWWLDADLQAPFRLLVTLAFFAVMRQSAGRRDILFPGAGRLETWSLAALIGSDFVGYFGGFWGIPIPVAAVLFMLGFRYLALTRNGTPDVIRGLRSTAGALSGSHLMSGSKEASYDAAEQIAEKSGRLAGTGDSNADPPAQGSRARLRAEIEELKRRIPAAGPPAHDASARRRRIRLPFRPAPAPAQRREYLTLPRPSDPARVLLDSGPAANWWDNGAEAVRTALALIIIAAGINVYIDVRDGAQQPLAFGFGLTDLLFDAAGSALGWVVLAFAFGACMPYLRGIRGPVKGLVVSLVHAAALGLADWLLYAIGAARSPSYIVHSLVFLFFLTTLGLLMDIRTVQRYGGSTGLFGRLYRLGDARAAVTYAAAIIVTILGIWQQASTLSQANAQRVQEGQQVVQSLNSMYGSGSNGP
jgi:hypothetical protein